jgi:DNA replication factor GINS
MNLNELQSVQSRERQTDSLQQLRGSFYKEAGRFIQQLREEREQVAERADDPFDAPDVQRLTNEINTAEQTVEAIYERRIGKLVKQASLEAAGMTADAEGLTTEEREAFDRLVSTIEENREHVLSVIENNQDTNADTTTEDSDGAIPTTHNSNTDPRTDPDSTHTPHSDPRTNSDPTHNSNPDSETNANSTRDEAEQSASSAETTEPAHTEETTPQERDGSTSPADSSGSIGSNDSVEVHDTDDVSQNVSVADVMGDGGAAFAQESNQSVPPDASLEAEPQNVSVHQSDAADTGNGNGDSGSDGTGDARSQINRATVKITRDVGKILCVDEREYDLSEDDVVELPETNVGPLLEHDAAERLG